jgi:hypothetical protein
MCNKSVPVYIIPDGRHKLVRVVLLNYIYRRWFRPYKTEIDCNRFICKITTTDELPAEHSPTPSSEVFKSIV